MAIFARLQDLRSALTNGFPARLLSLFVGGSLNQKVVALIGLSAVAYAVYVMVKELWTPLLVGAVGALMVLLAVKDFERASGPAP